MGERSAAGNKEGQLLLDLYMTVSRDRQKRGKAPLKLILFANAEEISTPVTNELEITDIMAEMQATNRNILFIPDRDIFLHRLTPEEYPITENERRGIFKGMAGTDWFDKSFGANFANNDFSSITHRSIKGFRCLYHLTYKRQEWYIWFRARDNKYHVNCIPGKFIVSYDLNKENDQKSYWLNIGVKLRIQCILGRMTFEKYSMYDIMVNFKSHFVI